MKIWYDGHCFTQEIGASVSGVRIYNSTLVWHFVKQAIREKKIPRELIDANMRTDYGKLRHLLTVGHHLNGNFSQLRSIIESGETVSAVVSSFPLEKLEKSENFVLISHLKIAQSQSVLSLEDCAIFKSCDCKRNYDRPTLA